MILSKRNVVRALSVLTGVLMMFSLPGIVGIANASGSYCLGNVAGGTPISVYTTECIYITGSSNHITSIRGVLTNDMTSYALSSAHIQIKYPSGATAKNCPSVYVDYAPVGTTSCTWSPNANEPIGVYCVTGWLQNSPTNYLNLGSACFKVTY